MSPVFMIVAILFPIVAGIVLPLTGIRDNRRLWLYVSISSVVTSVLVWALILWCPDTELVLAQAGEQLRIVLRFDGLGRFFAGIVATLWVLTILYAFEYMRHDERSNVFFSFFSMAYGVTLGVCMSGSLITLYIFYEFLTLATVPLVMHSRTRDAVRAARTYFVFSLGGSAFALLSIFYLMFAGGELATDNFRRLFYVLGVMGFGVKAALFPCHAWLPRASVAPTPVTALLHAVAVVKSGVFAVMRLTYYAYGVEALKGSWAQYLVLGIASFSVFYGATMAVKESHWKRRLAYSTVANLSYILVGVLMMSDKGLEGGMLHMAFHAEIKILAFFCAGAVLHQTGREYVRELDGMGYKMPWTFGVFTVSALALTGIPPFSGFVSKWNLLVAAAHEGSLIAYIGAGSILVAALLTAIYCFSVLRRAYFPEKGMDLAPVDSQSEGRVLEDQIHDPNLLMLVPMVILAFGILVTGLCGGSICSKVAEIVAQRMVW